MLGYWRSDSQVDGGQCENVCCITAAPAELLDEPDELVLRKLGFSDCAVFNVSAVTGTPQPPNSATFQHYQEMPVKTTEVI